MKKEGNTDGKKLWVDLFAKNRIRSSGCVLKYISPGCLKWPKNCNFRSDEVDPNIGKWKSALFGSIYGWSPQFKGMESFAMGRWKMFGLIFVQLIKDNIFLLNFENKEGKMRVLEGGPYTFDRRPLILLP